MAGCGGLSKRSVQLESRPRQRDPYFDNVRAVLITFVVIGHALEGMSSNLGDAVYLWIYSFHMPAFVIVTGYLSKTYRGSPRQYEQIGRASCRESMYITEEASLVQRKLLRP